MEARRQKRREATLQRQGLKPCDHPTKNIALCNAGLGTGLREENLLSVFGAYGCISRYMMIPGKSYSLVSYCDLESAICAFEKAQGIKTLCQNEHPLYLCYVTTIPDDSSAETTEMPNGLILLENFITSGEEELLLNCIDWSDIDNKNNMKNRRVKHFGYEFLYDVNNIDVNKPLEEKIPTACNFLWDRMKLHGYDFDKPPDQLTVNCYNPGQGIPSHVDTHSAFLSPLMSLSLGGSVVMDFKKMLPDGSFTHYHQLLPQRSLLIMDGSARYEWFHGISPKIYDIVEGKVCNRVQRTSFTFRWVRFDGQCDCNFPKHCDTFKKKTNTIENFATVIEQKHVHEVYEKIASHFSYTRIKIWPCVQDFISTLSSGSVLVDVGCGNGKNLDIRSDIISIGLEYSNGLAELAAWHKKCDEKSNKISLNQVIRGDCLYLPFKPESADAVICIAVLHHLVTEERRINAIREMIRILKVGGEALISVWAKDQKKDNTKTSYLKQNRKNRKSDADIRNHDCILETLKDTDGQSLNIDLPVHMNRTDFLHQDMLVPWKNKCIEKATEKNSNTEGDNNFMRFYHVFDEGELEKLCKFENIDIGKTFYEQGNWCLIFKKR